MSWQIKRLNQPKYIKHRLNNQVVILPLKLTVECGLNNFNLLEYHKLVIVKENEIGQEITVEVEACINRFTRIVYIIAKWFEEKEQRKTERLITNKSGKFKKSNYKLQKRILA